jgi:hypothetical protein
MSSSNDDGETYFIVALLLALIALVLFLVIGIAIRQVHGKAGAKSPVAMAVQQQVLIGQSVPADQVELQKPTVSTGSGSSAEARRVEVKLN